MRNCTFVIVIGVMALLAVFSGTSCQNPSNPVKSSGPVVDTLTANQIAGRYYGQVTIDNYESGTRTVLQGSATITPTDTPLDSTTCVCTFSIYIDTNPYASFTDLMFTAGHPLSLQRECSSSLFHYKFTGKCDGKTLSGIHDQYHLATDGTVGSHMFTLGFTTTRH